MLKFHYWKISRNFIFNSFVKPLVIASIPFGVPSVRKEVIHDALFEAFGHRIVLIDNLLAARFGAELDYSTHALWVSLYSCRQIKRQTLNNDTPKTALTP
jgi:actin-like ATPase involved in cell morphogenesis